MVTSNTNIIFSRFTIEYGEEGDSSLLIIDVLPEHDGKYVAEATNEVGKVICKAELFVEGKFLITKEKIHELLI